jgi:4-aminobutyrate aminotransferase-like enzyme
MMQDILLKDKQYISQVYSPDPVVFERADGMFMIDAEGKSYLDFSAQFSSCSLGHGNQELIKALVTQMQKIVSVTSMFVTRERVALGETLAEIAPKGLTKILFGCTGSDANEFALKAAKYFKGGGQIISFWRSFHGSTAGSAGATGKAETIQVDASISELLPKGFQHASPPYCYRCDFGMQYPQCSFQCLKFLEKQILNETKVAAIITEPVFAAGGVIVPPDGYFSQLRTLCDKYDILLILDEVVTGYGRTGTWFACENFDVVPDILVTGKALTGGYIPGSAVIMRTDIGEKMDSLTLHGHTHSNYPLMCASALKNLEIIRREGLVENSKNVGEYLHWRLLGLMEEFEPIGDVRGIGLLQGFEIVKNRETKEAGYRLGDALYKKMLADGLVTELESRENLKNCVVVLHPPLITSKEDVDKAIEIIRGALIYCMNQKDGLA